jgi:hypothetical protein
MQDMFFRLTIDVFANIAFGVELNSILGEVRFDERELKPQERVEIARE